MSSCGLELWDSRKSRRGGVLIVLLSVVLDGLSLLLAILGLSILLVESSSPLFWLSNELGFLFGSSTFSLDLYPGAETAFLCHATSLLVCWVALKSGSGLSIFQRDPSRLEAERRDGTQ